jgi:hypothetical protein
MRPDTTLLYLHIPKCGGTTLSSIIYDQISSGPGPASGGGDGWSSAEDDIYEGVYYYPGKGPDGGFFKRRDLIVPDTVKRKLSHPGVRAVVGHFWFGVHQFVPGSPTYITVLRDPVDRVLSLYHHLTRPGGRMRMSLAEFLDSPPYREVDNDQTRRISGLEPALGGCTRETLERAKENLRQHFTVAGVTERFDETVLLMKRRLGWTKDVLYYPKNTNPDRPPADTIPPATRDAILRWNELDAELYRFVSGRLDEMLSAQDASFREELRHLEERKAMLIEHAGAWGQRGAPR